MFLLIDEEGDISKTAVVLVAAYQMADDGLLSIIDTVSMKHYWNGKWEDIEDWEL